ncbi:hypothetical protein [Salmonirosea aquatica]|uniref:DUF3575 domain-containing protein n=1 Tax=Salmonirosea aquatica TaxID=2654236 RepID=A0A7C9BSX3_9BACT|nr:hypothetical protein [Cytophagaceae bacterium SJW1-29]
MTKKLFLFCWLLMAWQAQAQSVIIVPFNDIKDRIYRWPTSLVHGEVYSIEVTDVNRSLFGVEGSANQQNFNVDSPGVLTGFRLPGFATLTLPETKDAGPDILEMPDSGQEALREIDHQLETINDCYAYMEEVERLGNVITNLLRDCERPYGTLEEELCRITNAVLLVDKEGRAEQAAQLRDECLECIAAVRYARNVIAAQVLRIPATNVSPNAAEVAPIVAMAFQKVDEMDKLAKENKIQALLDNYNRINRANFTYVSDPFKASKDEVNLRLTFQADTLLTCNYPNRLTARTSIPVVGGWKVDFSTGVLFSGQLKNNHFFGQELYYAGSSEDSSQSFIYEKEAGTRLLLSIGAFAHLYKRTARKTSWALSPGVSTTTAFDGFLFHLGGSVLMGRETRLVLTLGATFKGSTLLDGRYRTDRSYPTETLPREVPTVQVFPRTGWFVALTYNLSSFRKSKE